MGTANFTDHSNGIWVLTPGYTREDVIESILNNSNDDRTKEDITEEEIEQETNFLTDLFYESFDELFMEDFHAAGFDTTLVKNKNGSHSILVYKESTKMIYAACEVVAGYYEGGQVLVETDLYEIIYKLGYTSTNLSQLIPDDEDYSVSNYLDKFYEVLRTGYVQEYEIKGLFSNGSAVYEPVEQKQEAVVS